MQSPRLFLIALTCLIAACGADDGLVVAEVDSYSITAPALRTYVERLPLNLHFVAGDSTAKRQYLQALIDRRLLLLEARARGLDTTDAVKQTQATVDSLESENLLLEVLKNTVGDSSLSEGEIRRFYRNRPELFYDESTQTPQPYEKAGARARSLLLGQRSETDLQLLLAQVRQKYHPQIRVYPDRLERALSDSLLQTRDQRRAVQLSRRGGALLQQGRPRRALTALERAIAFNPALDKAHFNRGLAHARLNQHDQALSAFERAIELNHHTGDYFYALGAALQAQHRYAEAAIHLQRAIELAPDQPHYHFRLGETFRSLVALEEARRAYAAALRLQPDLSDARYRYSDLLGRSGDLVGAAEGFERILVQEPRNVSALVGLAWVHTKAEQHHRAVLSLQQATRLAPDNANAHYLLSQAYAQIDQQAQADSVLAIFKRLSTAERHYNEGVKNIKQRNWGRASALLTQAIQIDSTYLQAYVGLGKVHLYQNAPDKGIAVLARALDLDSSNLEVRCLLGEAHLVRERPDSAQHFFAGALDLDSTSVRAHYGRGQAAYQSGDWAAALAAFQAALTIDADHGDTYYQLGLTYLKLGKHRKAAYSLQQCLEIDPDDVQANYALGTLYMHYGEPQLARRAFDKVLEQDPNYAKAREKRAQREHEN